MNDFIKELTVRRGAISVEDFLGSPPIKFETFDYKGPVTRSNFVSWLGTSFQLSRGEPFAQYVFFEWTKKNSGFNYKQSLENFFAVRSKHGNWNFLSSEEISLFVNGFKGVPKHQEKFQGDIDSYTPEDVFIEAFGQIEGLMEEFYGAGISIDNDSFKKFMKMKPETLKTELTKYAMVLKLTK